MPAPGFEKHPFAGDRDSGALQGSMKDDAIGSFGSRWSAEKARNLARRRLLERPGGISPANVAAIVPAQHAIESDVVKTAAKDLDLPEQVLDQVGKQAREIVALAVNRCGASSIKRCARRRHGEGQHPA